MICTAGTRAFLLAAVSRVGLGLLLLALFLLLLLQLFLLLLQLLR